MDRQLHLVHRKAGGAVVKGGTAEYYRSLRVDELKSAIQTMLRGVEGSIGRLTSEIRSQLLPALTILRQRLRHGHWEQFLRANRLNPATVRSWRARERAATRSLLGLLGEAVPPTLKRKAEMPESAARLLAAAGKRLAQEVLTGNTNYTRKLAAEYVEAYAAAGESVACHDFVR